MAKEKETTMYKLAEHLSKIMAIDCDLGCEIFCVEGDMHTAFHTNQMTDTLDCYTFTIIDRGRMTLIHNGKEVSLASGDIYCYTPGTECTVVSCTHGFRSFVLMADAMLTLSSPIVRMMIHATYFSELMVGEHKMHLKADDARHLTGIIRSIIGYQRRPHRFRVSAINTLYTLFLLDLMDIQEKTAYRPHFSERTEQLFIEFIQLARLHFIEHRDLAFYAHRLNITPVYLSRIVKRVSGHTVVNYLNHLVLMEAMHQLLGTDLTIAKIAECLHFADQSSFTKFFIRMRGVGPKKFRTRK